MPGAALAEARSGGEAAAARAFAAARSSHAALRVFLQAMPKGGDLHDHLGGAIYAEDYIAAAAAEGFCVNAALTTLSTPPCEAKAGQRAVAGLGAGDPMAYGKLVDALSTRGWQQGIGAGTVSGHDQFFGSFSRFGAVYSGHLGQWLALARQQAARDHVSYLELMHDGDAMIAWAQQADAGQTLTEAQLPDYLAQALADADLKTVVAAARAELDQGESEAGQALGCRAGVPEPACAVTVRYMAQALRGWPPASAFRSLIASFALAAADPRLVGVNIVMPEDDPVALRDYSLHMAMFRLLEAHYPGVAVSMHAGELARDWCRLPIWLTISRRLLPAVRSASAMAPISPMRRRPAPLSRAWPAIISRWRSTSPATP